MILKCWDKGSGRKALEGLVSCKHQEKRLLYRNCSYEPLIAYLHLLLHPLETSPSN